MKEMCIEEKKCEEENENIEEVLVIVIKTEEIINRNRRKCV